ncbi:T6SS effector phospholipase Tle3 domain-containing protein [Burkholderia sp. BCC0322]|uniref:T6SS effector phospholipase Tle3 domain-containing protein n=1 Tax=unclassified Burkholderia TaxID=2613784 RepID=UPI00158F1C16|nr:DUF3274 domain-containing protein [Burkholderia sp. BCC0322]
MIRDNFGVTGAKWTPTKAVRPASKPNDDVAGNAALVFAERDNRGKVYLYFCPEDATVALNGVNGMGAAGRPDSMSVRASRSGAKAESVPLLSNAFRQRIFTRRLRNGQPVLVGNAPGPFTLRLKGESAHGTTNTLEAC